MRTASPAPGPRRVGRRGATLAAAALATLTTLAGCADGGAAAPGQVAGPGVTRPADDPTAVAVDNCGTPVSLDAPPERVVAIKSSMIELVLALGAGDRLVGTAFPDGPLPETPLIDARAAADVPLLSEKVPSAEALLGVGPDLVMAGWESTFTAEGAGDRGTLASLGVATYVAPSACKDPGHRPDRLTFGDVFRHVEEAGALLGVPDAAADLVAQQRATLETVAPDDRRPTALWYSSGEDVPYVGAGIGAPQMIMDAVGLRNVAADVPDTWTSFGWEAVGAADPDVIVLVDAAWNTAEQKRQHLAANPATAHLSAVRAERYLVVPFPATEAGVRNVDAVVDLARQLAALDLG